MFFRQPCYGGIQRTGRPGSREKEIGFEKERERERERERYRKRKTLRVFQIGELYLRRGNVLGGACGACGNPQFYVRIHAIFDSLTSIIDYICDFSTIFGDL